MISPDKRVELEMQALAEYARHLDTVIWVTKAQLPEEGGAVHTIDFRDYPQRAVVRATEPDKLLRWQGDWLVPEWKVEFLGSWRSWRLFRLPMLPYIKANGYSELAVQSGWYVEVPAPAVQLWRAGKRVFQVACSTGRRFNLWLSGKLLKPRS